MLTSLIALSLSIAPVDLDLSPRHTVEVAAPVKAETAPVAAPWTTPPMVSAEGRTAKLLTDDQLARVQAIDERLAAFTTLPTRAITVLGGVVASAPFVFATGYAFFFVAELAAQYSAVTLIFSMFTFPAGFIVGLMAVPVWGWVVAAAGLSVAMVAGLVTMSMESDRAALLAERKALIDSTKRAPIDATSLVTVGTF